MWLYAIKAANIIFILIIIKIKIIVLLIISQVVLLL